MTFTKKDIMTNPELIDNKYVKVVDGVKVRIFPSTHVGDSVTAEILEGPNKGKWTTVTYSNISFTVID
jgi:hypothetical protein